MDLDSSAPQTAPTSPALTITPRHFNSSSSRVNVALLKVNEVNYDKPENARNKILFENLTPLHANSPAYGAW